MDKIDQILTRGVANIIPDKDKLKKALLERKLNVYLGIDPTAPRIHLGHAVPLIKLAELLELKHNITLLIGDFTALIGDTSDKDSERPVLTEKEIEKNFRTYKKQAEKIIDISKIKVRYNSEWLKKLDFTKIIKLTQQFSFGDFASRELIKKRLSAGKYVGLHEALYPAMQGYDSYYMDIDLQIGGTDQTFNMQAGRILQKKWRNKESFILATEFLSGTDGRKMSKSLNNAIWLDDLSQDIYSKIMAINDNLIIQYYTLATRVSQEEIENVEERLKKENPINIKKELAFEIVKMLNGINEAKKAQEYFEKTVQKGEIKPIEIRLNENKISLAKLLVQINLASSISEAKRLIGQGGITINESKVNDPESLIEEYLKENEEIIIKRGKIKAVKIKIK